LLLLELLLELLELLELPWPWPRLSLFLCP
jgi:hypothetical protein